MGANPEVRKRKTQRGEAVRPSVLAPGSALGSVPTVALSSAQAGNHFSKSYREAQ